MGKYSLPILIHTSLEDSQGWSPCEKWCEKLRVYFRVLEYIFSFSGELTPTSHF